MLCDMAAKRQANNLNAGLETICLARLHPSAPTLIESDNKLVRRVLVYPLPETYVC